jgi:capsular exopolysaccharide synthesis family protein
MDYHDSFHIDTGKKILKPKSSYDPLVILGLLLRRWYIFAIGGVIGFFFARFYIGHTMPVYESDLTVLINETDDRPLVDNSELLQGLGLPGGMKNMENQIMVLKSRGLIEKTLKELPFEADYYFKTWRNKLPIYPEIPISVISDSIIPLPRDTEFSISFLENNAFNLQSESKYFPFQKVATFDENINMPKGSFRVECWNEDWLAKNRDKKLYFTIHSRSGLIGYYSGRLNIEKLSRDGSMLRISLTGTNPSKDVDFLNKHIEGFQNISLDKKNIEAQRRIQFIDDQLVGISDSLSTTENKLQQFRSSHRVMDLSAQGQAIIGQVTLLENEKARLDLEANYYDYLVDYLSKDVSGELPIIPITMGITDPTLTRLVNELTELQGQLTTRGAGEMNPIQRNLTQRVQTIKNALRETLNGLRRANSLARSENQDQINRANSQASTLPVTERQLLGFERRFTLNNELYTFLLETRAEQQMQKASNRSDSEIIDKADDRFSTWISPDPIKIYSFGLFAGVGIPMIVIILLFLFNKRVNADDIKKINIPVVGNIPHSDGKSATIVLNDPNSIIAEAFRLLRSRMQFLTKEAVSPVILITSSMPSDGKTFTAINLASAYSLLNKKIVCVGFDLRNPKIYQDFSLSNERGVSTWLIGMHKLDEIIQDTAFKNLSIISAGPIPPNPSELIALEKTKDLIRQLKERFDYIIIDSSPLGLVSDTLHLASVADTCLLVIRPGYTLRDMFEASLEEFNSSDPIGLSLVVNDTQVDKKHYGYGEKYGYTSNQKRIKKSKLSKSDKKTESAV